MRLIISIFLLSILSACHKPTPNQLVVGTISGPETELVEAGKAVALKKYGLDVRIVEFTDYNLPNVALEDGSLDANVFQHAPYLSSSITAHGYHLEPIGKTFVFPIAIYSSKFKSLQALPDKAIVAVPNDPSNETRALILLEKAGLITLKKGNLSGINDIATNHKELLFKEIDAAQLPRILTDVDAAVINTNFAVLAGLNPEQNALFSEDKDSPYANLIVIRKDSGKRDKLELLVKSLNSLEVKDKAKALFGNAAIPAW